MQIFHVQKKSNIRMYKELPDENSFFFNLLCNKHYACIFNIRQTIMWLRLTTHCWPEFLKSFKYTSQK